MQGTKMKPIPEREVFVPQIQIKPRRKRPNLEDIFKVNVQDQVVQKTKVYIDPQTNQLKEETKEFTIPMELNVSKKIVPVIKRANTIEQVRSFEKKLIKNHNLTMQALEREKVVFRMYLNIKKRYRFNPNKFIRLFKLYLNDVPVFQER